MKCTDLSPLEGGVFCYPPFPSLITNSYCLVTTIFLSLTSPIILVRYLEDKLHKKGKHKHEGKHKDAKEDLFDQALVKGPQNLLDE